MGETVCIDAEYNDGLKRMSRTLGVSSESEIARRTVGAALSGSGFAPSGAVSQDPEERKRKWRETLKMMERMTFVTPPGEPVWDREILYDERVNINRR